MAIDDIDFDATMSASYDASESGADYVSPTNDVDESADDGGENTAAASNDIDAAAEQEQDQDTAPALEPADTAPLEPPARWSSDDKAQFSALAPEAQKLVLKREHDVESYLTRKSQELSQTENKYKGLDEVLEGRREALVMNYGSEAGGVRALFAYSDMADKTPVEFIYMLAKAKNIDLASLAEPSDEYSDPQISALEQKVAMMEQQHQAALQMQTRQQQQEIIDQVNAFETAVGDDGKPAHPHFAKVRVHMSGLLTSGTAKSMQDAYDQAVWAHPETRRSVMGGDEHAKLAAQKAKAAAAEKAASIRPRSSNGQFVAASSDTIEDTMASVYDSMHSAN